jgi:hypothetical protein
VKELKGSGCPTPSDAMQKVMRFTSRRKADHR